MHSPHINVLSRIQEKLADKYNDSGKIPRSVICELMGDLIDSTIPGDVVSVTGVVKPFLWNEGIVPFFLSPFLLWCFSICAFVRS